MVITSKISKAALCTAAAGAMALSSAPAQAQQYRGYDRDNDGISAGEVIAGVAILGGLAAILSSRGNDRDYRGGSYGYDNNGYNNGYGYDNNGYGYDRSRYGDSRQAVQQCVSATQNEARRYSRGGARITGITNINRNRDGYTVRGRLAVQDYRGGYGGYGNRSGYDTGSFKCQVRYGRVVDVDVSGIR